MRVGSVDVFCHKQSYGATASVVIGYLSQTIFNMLEHETPCRGKR